jgi:putative SbcD/Mre11-related phosphoesterase
MDKRTMAAAPGALLDARRALWLVEHRTLVVADLHLGYAWAHRRDGQLLPLASTSAELADLQELITTYDPARIVLLGDIIHRASDNEPLRAELRQFLGAIPPEIERHALIGNHDRGLAALLRDCRLEAHFSDQLQLGRITLSHGDEAHDATAAARLREVRVAGGLLIIGHEHPAITLGDGVTPVIKCPCFLSAPELLVLPAFSRWAAGTNVRAGRFLSAFSRATTFERAVAIVAGKLLPIRL